MSKRYSCVFLIPAVALAAALLAAGGAAGVGEEEETAGNNLSFPVIWGEPGDAATLTLAGTYGTVLNGGACYTDDAGVSWYYQKDALNSWQAASAVWGKLLPVTSVDWGDNLEARDWKTTSKVRVETVLYKDLGDSPMDGYAMLWIEGQGTDEIWGADLRGTIDSYEATVYSNLARLTIQKIDPTVTLTWNPATHQWDGAGVRTDFNAAAWEGVEDGPGGYGAEINVKGKVIYGYNWDVLAISGGDKGTYRITFSLDPGALTLLDESTVVLLDEETTTDSGSAPSGGGTAVIVPANNLTYIDVTIKGGGGRR